MKSLDLLSTVFILSLLAGCASSITDRNILGGEFYLGTESQENLVPGNTYKVYVSFDLEDEDEPVTNVYWDELRVYNLGRRTILPSPFRIRMPDFDFSLLEDPLYVVSLEVDSNPFPAMARQYGIRWDLSRRFSFSGRTGETDSWGARGSHGSPGPLVDVEVAYYDVTGTNLEGTGTYLLINVPQYKRYALVNLAEGPFTVVSRGGRGGSGEDGESNYATQEQPEVYGGDGSDGYDGGTGGVIILRYPNEQSNWRSYFDLRVPGGEGGDGGQGGRGDRLEGAEGLLGVFEAVGGVNHGEDGRDGRRGPDGRIEAFSSDLSLMFLSITDPLFDRERLMGTLPTLSGPTVTIPKISNSVEE
jgi:hypothetical protein